MTDARRFSQSQAGLGECRFQDDAMIFRLAISLLFLVSARCLAREFRIDSQAGFDALKAAVFQPGDRILFKRGERFFGAFEPRGSGSSEAPIKLGVYGQGERPRIDALGKHQAGLLLENVSFWEVDGLEITNTDGSDGDQGSLFGIRVVADEGEGIFEHIYINDCYIHDVNGKVAGKQRGGIHVHMERLKSSIFHDLRITNNRIVRVGGVGIGNTSSCGEVEFTETDAFGRNLWTQVYVAGNYIDHTGRNSIIARVSKDAIYERNILANSSRYDTGHSIFCFNTDGIKIQYNEAYGNVGDGGMDRGGFDADYNCVNTYIQYNYSHDNLWFCGIMKRRNRNVVIRYNVSQNDKEGIYFYGFDKESKARGIHIYNNTHYVRKGLEVSVFPEGRTPIHTLFENNIFFFEGEGNWGEQPEGDGVRFSNNLYFGIDPHPTDSRALVANPKLSEPGRAGTDIDLVTMEALNGYQLLPGSPCIDQGRSIDDDGGRYLLGKKGSESKTHLGAFGINR